jgi:hypothetical protein
VRPLLRVELLGQLHRSFHVREEHRHLLALALERGLRLQDLVGEMLRGVVAGRALGRARALPSGSRSRFAAHRADPIAVRGDPREDPPLERRHLLHVHQLLDECLGLVVVQLEFDPQGAEGEAPVPFQQEPCPLDRPR